MPIKRCEINGKKGYKWGDSGKCYENKEDALEQMRAIKSQSYWWGQYIIACECCQEVDEDNLFIPAEEDYEDYGEETETISISEIISLDKSKAAEYQGKKVTLNKPFRTPDGPKEMSVYVKNDKGNVVKVNFGDSDMELKRDNPDRKKNFCKRHNCDSPGPRWKAKFWSCKRWKC